MTMYDDFAKSSDGERRLARARLRYSVLRTLSKALADAGLNKSQLAERLGIRKSAVSQVFGGVGNVRVNTVADYLWAMGCELDIRALPVGSARRHHTISATERAGSVDLAYRRTGTGVLLHAFDGGQKSGSYSDSGREVYTDRHPTTTPQMKIC